MNIEKKVKSTSKKQWKSIISKKTQKMVWAINDINGKEQLNSPDDSVSVFTRTTNPKVIIKSENIIDNWNISWRESKNKHRLLKFLCVIIMCLIILMTFFLSLRTYNTVNELSKYLMS